MATISPAPDPAAFQSVLGVIQDIHTNAVVGTLLRRNVPDCLASGPRRFEEVASRSGLHPLSTARALRLLAGYGVFEEVSPGVFANNAASRLLRNQPGGMRNFAFFMTSEGFRNALGALQHSLITGESCFRHVHGESIWDYLGKRPEEVAAFNAMFAEVRGGEQAAIAKAYDWSAANTVVDVGGGNGSLLATILAAEVHLRGVLFDRPEGLKDSAEHLASRGVHERCRPVAGSFFEPIPAQGDIWILSQILHDWSDAESRVILNRCRAQMRPEDRLLVIEMLTVPCRPSLEVGIIDITMLALFGEARQRTEEEYGALFGSCKLALARVIPTESAFSIVEARPV